jgi:hypothetical protein
MTRRPPNVRKRVDVPFAKPRNINLKLEPEFQVMRREIDAVLKERDLSA